MSEALQATQGIEPKMRRATSDRASSSSWNFVDSATAPSLAPVVSEVVLAEIDLANDDSALVVKELLSAKAADIEKMTRTMERPPEVSHDKAVNAVWIARELQHRVGA